LLIPKDKIIIKDYEPKNLRGLMEYLIEEHPQFNWIIYKDGTIDSIGTIDKLPYARMVIAKNQQEVKKFQDEQAKDRLPTVIIFDDIEAMLYGNHSGLEIVSD